MNLKNSNLTMSISMQQTSNSRINPNRSYFLVITCTMFLLLSFCSNSQDLVFNQFFNVTSLYNPANCGTQEGIVGKSLYRINFPGTNWNSQSVYVGTDIGSVGLPANGGLGLFYMTGFLPSNWYSINTYGLNASGRIPFSTKFGLRIGLCLSLINFSIDLDKWRDIFSNELDPYYGGIYQDTTNIPEPVPVTKADLGAGTLFQFLSTNGYFKGGLGFSVKHIFRPDMSDSENYPSRLKTEWIVHGNLEIDVNKGKSVVNPQWDQGFKIFPGFCYNYQNNSDILIGLDLTKLNVFFGIWYRGFFNKWSSANAIIFNIGYQFFLLNGLSIKPYYCCELRFQKYIPGNRTLHEISLALQYEKLRFSKKKNSQ